jgi:hypothetical protein
MSLRGPRLAFAPVPAFPTGAGKKAGGRGNLLRNEQKKPSLSLWFFLEHFLWFVGYAILRIRIRTTLRRIVNSCSLFVILSVKLLSRTKSDEKYATRLIGIIWCGFEISVFIFFVFFYSFSPVCFYFAALAL